MICYTITTREAVRYEKNGYWIDSPKYYSVNVYKISVFKFLYAILPFVNYNKFINYRGDMITYFNLESPFPRMEDEKIEE